MGIIIFLLIIIAIGVLLISKPGRWILRFIFLSGLTLGSLVIIITIVVLIGIGFYYLLIYAPPPVHVLVLVSLLSIAYQVYELKKAQYYNKATFRHIKPEVLIEKGKKIILVDDDDFISGIYKEHLEKAGFEVIYRNNADTLVQDIVEHQPDIISLDTLMPGTSGFNACKLLKSKDNTKRIPIFFNTNEESGEDVKRAFKMGAIDYLTKSKILAVDMASIYSSYLNDPKNYKRIRV